MSTAGHRTKEMRRLGWLTATAAAVEAKVYRATIYRWMDAGMLETTKVGGSRFVSMESLRKALGPMASPQPKPKKGRRR